MARIMLDEYNTPDLFWCDAINIACHAINRLYLHKKLKKNSYELLTGFLLGYGSNEHAYRVFNKTSGRVEITVDVTFDESNSSQVEQVDSSVVGKEDPPCEEIKQLAIGDIRPQEDEVTKVQVPQVAAAPISADKPDAEQQQTPVVTPAHGSAAPTQSAWLIRL
ncbi:uncharacterized protein [Miscanthus floridulus]|uniref:uncharacterized protein n=1 Tax=Miscanthus floridulus TaxID=154761 RepID=UPI0034575EFE